jgi:RNA polymerase sigma factor (sigma-70 family)
MAGTVAVFQTQVSSERHTSNVNETPTAQKAYQELGGVLFGYLRTHLKSSEDAQDMAQEVYLRIANQIEERDILSLKAFVFAIARNLLTDKSRRCATRLAANCISIDDVTLAAPMGDPFEQVEMAETFHKMQTTVANLRPKCRQAYLLSRLDGLSYGQIATRMKISVSMVEKHISAARCVLRRAASEVH